MSFTNCVFGWILLGTEEVPIAYHTGIIAEWNDSKPEDSIVLHYGVNSQPIIRIETLEEAMQMSKKSKIYVNTDLYATFSEPPFSIDKYGNYIVSKEIIDYEKNHSEYNIFTCNCQHFVRHFTKNIYIESDIVKSVGDLIQTFFINEILSNRKETENKIQELSSCHLENRNNGICKWNYEIFHPRINEFVIHPR